MSNSFFHTNISPLALELVNQVLGSGYISAGKMAEKFEKELATQLGFVNPVTVNSGTSALHLALILAGVGKDDEVILPAQTFIATGLVVLMQGAKPVFADIQPDTGNIAPDSIRDKITSKTKVIIPVHWSGYPCDLDEINKIADENNLIVIEDAAHALGAQYKSKPIGSVSKFTAFSFQAIKHLTTGDGGALCCNGLDEYKRAKRLRWFDIDRENSEISVLGEREYDASDIGYKYHMNDLAASLGLGNLNNLTGILAHHRKIAKVYSNGLGKIPGLKQMNYKTDRESSWWFYQICVEKRIDFIRALKGNDIPTSVVHLRIDRNSVFGGINEELFGQKIFNESQVSLPVHCGIAISDAERIVEIIKKGW
jgi:perosamine synthetase